MKPFVPFVSFGLLTALTFSACETGGANALAGAAAGAAVGGLLHGSGRDALHGAAIGAGAGYLIGKVVNHERDARARRAYDDGYYESDGRYPVGDRTNRRGFVISPYPPYNTIDVRGIPPGEQVLDPSTNKIFINP